MTVKRFTVFSGRNVNQDLLRVAVVFEPMEVAVSIKITRKGRTLSGQCLRPSLFQHEA